MSSEFALWVDSDLAREFLDESEELLYEIAQEQKEFQERIFENI